MTTKSWSTAALNDGDVITNGNINAPGNGDFVTWITPTGTPTLLARNVGGLPGVGLSSDVTTEVMRLDLRHAVDASADAAGQALQFVFQAPGGGPSIDQPLVMARSAAGFAGYVYHRPANNDFQIRNSLNVNVSSSVAGSATTAATPGMVAGNRYQCDFALMNNTNSGVTPSISNGRIQARLRDLTNPAGWNSGAEWYMDTGYTANVSNADPLALQQYFRFLKPLAGATFPEQFFAGVQWKDITAPVTSLTKASAIANFVTPTGPVIGLGDTGPGYVIEADAVADSFSIAQTSGPTTAPRQVGAGSWLIPPDTTAARVYVVTATNSAGSTTRSYTVPATALATSNSNIYVPVGSSWLPL